MAANTNDGSGIGGRISSLVRRGGGGRARRNSSYDPDVAAKAVASINADRAAVSPPPPPREIISRRITVTSPRVSGTVSATAMMTTTTAAAAAGTEAARESNSFITAVPTRSAWKVEVSAGLQLHANRIEDFEGLFNATRLSELVSALSMPEKPFDKETLDNIPFNCMQNALRFENHKEQVWVIGLYTTIGDGKASVPTTIPLITDPNTTHLIGIITIYVGDDAFYIGSRALNIQWLRNMTYVQLKEEAMCAVRTWFAKQKSITDGPLYLSTRVLHDQLPDSHKHLLNLETWSKYLAAKKDLEVSVQAASEAAAAALAATPPSADATTDTTKPLVPVMNSISPRPIHRPRPAGLIIGAAPSGQASRGWPESTTMAVVSALAPVTQPMLDANWNGTLPSTHSPLEASPRHGRVQALREEGD